MGLVSQVSDKCFINLEDVDDRQMYYMVQTPQDESYMQTLGTIIKNTYISKS